jgi:hypothetical protein
MRYLDSELEIGIGKRSVLIQLLKVNGLIE